MRLRCSHLGVSFASLQGLVCALSDLSFETREREFLAFVGPSGCGKTSLLRVLAGAVAPIEGEVERIPSAADRNQDVLLVSQEHSLFPWMTVMENAAFGCEMQRVPRREREGRARELLHRLGFASREHSYPHELSLGMKQRVAVARCFLSDPAVMLMDEPFAALDCQTRLLLQQELLDLWEQSHKTVVFVTHDVEEAILLSDRILVLSRQPGHVVAQFSVQFPRPRATAVTMTEDFLFLKKRVAGALGMKKVDEAEVTAAREVSWRG
jgi:NitT/TauT family transport system ATP-binding protein